MRILILGIVGLSGLGFVVQSVGVHGSTNERAAIRRALHAPFADLKQHDARALCDDFTPPVAAQLTSGSGDCAQRVSALFVRTRGAVEYTSPGDGPAHGRLGLSTISWHGDRATAASSDRSAGAARGPLRLEMHGQRWRIATPARLELRADCTGHPFGGSGCVDAISLRFAGV